MPQNAYLDAKFRFDTDENEPRKEWCVVAPAKPQRTSSPQRSPTYGLAGRPRMKLGSRCGRCGLETSRLRRLERAFGRNTVGRLATTHHSFLGSFSAVSKRNFATKYAFFQVFRDLQNYLADFLKKLQNFAKNRKILQNFCEISGFLQKKCWFLRKSLIFCKILQNFWKFSQIVL